MIVWLITHLISCGGGPAGNGLGTLVCLPLFLAYKNEHWRGGPTTCGRKADIGAMHKVDSRTIAFMVDLFFQKMVMLEG